MTPVKRQKKKGETGDQKMKVYHAGYDKIIIPDIHRGRVNADFGQGFYMSDSREFACRWVREKKGSDIIVNSYELDDADLKVKSFDRDSEWFRYVFSNRRSMPDELSGIDVIIGPIANDTIFNTLGIMTSGYLSDEDALKLLCIGPLYKQIVIKSQRAADRLTFISSEIIMGDEIRKNRDIVASEEEAYLQKFAKVMQELYAG